MYLYGGFACAVDRQRRSCEIQRVQFMGVVRCMLRVDEVDRAGAVGRSWLIYYRDVVWKQEVKARLKWRATNSGCLFAQTAGI